MRNLSPQEYQDKRNLLIKLKCNFKEVLTNSGSKYLLVGKKKNRYYCNLEEEIPRKELYLFKLVQEEANEYLKNNPERFAGLQSYHVDFMLCNFKKGTQDQEFQNLLEIDINSAYTAAAVKIGIISKKTAQLLNEASKPTRLRVLGAIASKKTITEFIEGRPQETHTETKDTRHLFFAAAKMVTDVMKEVTRKNQDILFYWVDAFFLRPAAALEITNALDKAQFDYKTKIIDKMTVENDKENFCVKFQSYYKKGQEKKTKPYLFSYRSRIDNFNHLAQKERTLFDRIENGNFVDLAAEIKSTYNTDELKRMPVVKIIRKFNSLGMKAKDFLRVKNYFEGKIEKHSTDLKTGITYKETLFYYLDRMEEASETVDHQWSEERELLPIDTEKVKIVKSVRTVATLENATVPILKDENGNELF